MPRICCMSSYLLKKLLLANSFFFFFFFQAEDGIRDRTVTGVQTCALPICRFRRSHPSYPATRRRIMRNPFLARSQAFASRELHMSQSRQPDYHIPPADRSEERRVGKECRARRGAEQYKRKRMEMAEEMDVE